MLLDEYFDTFGEGVTKPLHAALKQPVSLSLTDAASVWMIFATSVGVLIENAHIGKGKLC